MSRDIDRKVAEALGCTDIAAAIGTLEEFCKARHWTCKIEMLAHDGLWVVWIYSASIDNCRSYGGTVKEALPAAICNAILSANAGEGKG